MGEVTLQSISQSIGIHPTCVHPCSLSAWVQIRHEQTNPILSSEPDTLTKTAHHLSLNKMKGPSHCRCGFWSLYKFCFCFCFPKAFCLRKTSYAVSYLGRVLINEIYFESVFPLDAIFCLISALL